MSDPSVTSATSEQHRPLALVTGAAGIIGPAIVTELRRQGWRVAATDRDGDSFSFHEKTSGTPVVAEGIFHAELGSQKACSDLILRVEGSLGPISAIINNAAGGFLSPLEDIDEADLQKAMEVNFASPVFLVQAALPSLLRNKGGVVNISSVLVSELRKKRLLYSCSKAALEKATEIMALEMGESGVRVNTIRIGRVLGIGLFRETLEKLPDELARKMVEDLHPKRLDYMRGVIGPHAVGVPEDVAQSVVFLLSPTSRFINGQTLILDGGFQQGPDQQQTANAEFDSKLIAQWLEENSPSAN